MLIYRWAAAVGLFFKKLNQFGGSGQDTLVVLSGVLFAYACALMFNLSEEINAQLATFEYMQLDELPLTLFVFALLSVWFSQRRVREIYAEVQLRTDVEKQLRTSQRLYKALFDGDLTGNVVLDLDGNISMYNRAFERICNPSNINQNACALFSFDWSVFLAQLRQYGEINFNKMHIQRPDGVPCYVSTRFIYVSAEEGDRAAQIHGYLVDMTEQCTVELDLERTLKENRELARHAMHVQEKERKYIASEIHDDTGQYLMAIRMDALSLQKSVPEQAALIASRIASNTQHIQQSIRALIKYLRPPILDSLGLDGAVEQMVREWRVLNRHVACDLNMSTNQVVLHEDVNIVAFRVVQEALTNISRHAEASEVTIHIQLSKRQSTNSLQIEIRDNGKGMDMSKSTLGVGLIGMRERIESLKGSFQIVTASNAGTLIAGLIPLSV